MKPITVREIAKAVNGTLIQNEKTIHSAAGERTVTHITTDSRNIPKGALFIALQGENFDGHSFISQAFEKGAICALSCKEISASPNTMIIQVADTSEALQDLARYYVSLFQIPIIAVTGSVGKTTTKDMIASVLSQKYNTLKTNGNFNNEIGLPLTIFRLEEAHEAAVLEMGMNHFGEIHKLARIAQPHIAVITNIGVSHIENLGSQEGILKAKSEIFDYFNEGDTAVLNAEDERLLTLEAVLKNEIIWFGRNQKKGVYADNIQPQGLDGIDCRIHILQDAFDVHIPAPGEHMVLNSLAAAAVGYKLGLSIAEIKQGISCFESGKMRMDITKTNNGLTIINDAYNANPVSAKAAIDVLAHAQGNKICILGDMFELGAHAIQMHKEVGIYAAKKEINTIICIGALCEFMYQGAAAVQPSNVFYYATQEEFWEQGLDKITKGSTVLMKASRGMHFEKTVEKLQEVK